MELSDLLAGSEKGEAVQGNEDAPSPSASARIDHGGVRAERPARLAQDGTDDRDFLPADVLLRREEIAALCSRVGARLDANDPVVPQIELGL